MEKSSITNREVYEKCSKVYSGVKVMTPARDREFIYGYNNYKPFLPKLYSAPKFGCVKILDFGCGSGNYLNFFLGIGYNYVFGIDISKECIKYTKENITPNCKYVKSSFNFLKTHQNKYDVILLQDVIEHIVEEEVIELMKLLYNALDKNGILLMKVPNASSPIATSLRWGDLTHHTLYNQKSLEVLLRAGGFKEWIIRGEIPNNPLIGLLRKIYYFFYDKYHRFLGGNKTIYDKALIVCAKK